MTRMRSNATKEAKLVCAKKLLSLKNGPTKKTQPTKIINRRKTMIKSLDPFRKNLAEARRILANGFKNYIRDNTDIIFSKLAYNVYKFTPTEQKDTYGVVDLDTIIANCAESLPDCVSIDKFMGISVRVRKGSTEDKNQQVNIHPSFIASVGGKCYKLSHTDIRAC